MSSQEPSELNQIVYRQNAITFMKEHKDWKSWADEEKEDFIEGFIQEENRRYWKLFTFFRRSR